MTLGGEARFASALPADKAMEVLQVNLTLS